MSRLLYWAVGALVALSPLLACTTHMLGDADLASVRANERLDHHVYCGLAEIDAGNLRTDSKIALRNDVAILRRNGAPDDGGASVCP